MQENYKQTITRIFFEIRNNLYFYHLMTTNYARHKAAGDIVTKFDTLIDNFLEQLYGKYNRPTNFRMFEIQTKNNNDIEIINILNDYIQFLTNQLPKMLDINDTNLLNIRDEMVGALNNTKYLFTLQ